MKTLNDHLKTGQFKNVYLIYGPEVYLRKQYRDRLVKAILGDGDQMNYNYFEGKGLDVREIIGLCETMPFFASKRVVVVENSQFFSSSQDELTEYVSQIPETTCLIFVEENADKRSKLFKAVSKAGYAANMASPDEKTLKLWLGQTLKKAGKAISEATAMHFLETVDNDMENIRQETEKLICYTEGRDVVTTADVDAICSVHIESKIFEMIQAVASKQQRQAMRLYQDLLTLKEPPMRILFLLARQFNMLLEIKELTMKGYTQSIIAQKTGIRDFIVRKNMSLTRAFSFEELRGAVENCAEMEEAVKTGRMPDQLAVELIIIQYSR